jgi:hypothetical protein
MANVEQVFQLKVTLEDIKPPIWRRIEVPGSYTFWDLHVAIQDAMGWQDYHLHEFLIKRLNKVTHIGVPHDDFPMEVLPGWENKIADYLSPEFPKLDYSYDFGDDWLHRVLLEKVIPALPGGVYPRCIKGKRACPPEDCGGAYGYQRLLKILSDPKHHDYNSRKSWVESVTGGPYDPEHFDAAKISFSDPQALQAGL